MNQLTKFKGSLSSREINRFFFLLQLQDLDHTKRSIPFYGMFCKARGPGKTYIRDSTCSGFIGVAGVFAQEMWLTSVGRSVPGTNGNKLIVTGCSLPITLE